MKLFASMLLLVASLSVGCALFGGSEKQEADFKPVPNSSDTQPGTVVVTAPEPAPTEPVAPAPAPPAPVETPAPVEPVAAAPAEPVQPPPARVTRPVKTVVTPEFGLRGKVAAYNGVGRFVVLSFQVGRMPDKGQQMFIYRSNAKIGEVRITGPQRDENTVADLVDGDASAGDEVRDK